MNRIIKFRAWDKEEKSIYQDFHETYMFGEAVSANNESDGKYILMQFTGLLDKNGKEIYEGDIVEISWGKNKDREVIENMGFDLKCTLLESGGGTEVIGNIYENPELLDE